jgi:uncharacterized protein YecT (DUF1311 family)
MRRLLLSAAVAACSTAWSAEGQCTLCTNEYASCLASTEGMAYAIQACQASEQVRQETRLNTAYTHAMARLSTERQRELRQVQRLWLRYRAANGGFFLNQGLSGHKIEALATEMQMTALRVGELERIQD